MFNRMAFLSVSILLSTTLIGSACSENINASGYAFEQPDRVYELPDSLDEISGLTLLDRHHLGAIHDDSDNLFIIDLRSGKLTERYDMGSVRDYEGIELVGNTIYVLASNGNLFEISDWKKSRLITARYKTGLDRRYDNEGLAFDAARQYLLIASKEYSGKAMKGFKVIYAFDLKQKRLLPEPVYKIDLVAVEKMARGSNSKKKKKKWWKRAKTIKPAALAMHPVTKQLFIISSSKRRLVILNADGTLAAAYKLPKQYFAQPEGMAFLPNGDLFISNEKANRKAATLLRFNYRAAP